MPFDVTKADQTLVLSNSLAVDLYKKLHESSKTSPHWVALSGFPVGISIGLLTLATLVGGIAENLFKGMLNIGGSLCCVESCRFSVGVGMLVNAAALTAIGIPISLLYAVWTVFEHTFKLCKDPVNATHQLWMRYDPAERTRYNREWATETIKTEPENVDALMILADWAKEKERYEEWLTHCQKAADLENKDALYQMGVYYSASGDESKGNGYLNRAANAGSEQAKKTLESGNLVVDEQMAEIAKALKET